MAITKYPSNCIQNVMGDTWYCVIDNNCFIYLDSICCMQGGSIDKFLTTQQSCLDKFLNRYQHSWSYYETRGFKCISIQIEEL
jgi:hypothetical protein